MRPGSTSARCFSARWRQKPDCRSRIAGFVVDRVGLSYSRLLLGLVVISFLLTFIVPSGVARVVIMAPICIGIIDLFGVDKNSNIGRGMFLLVTYTCAIFDKMIIAGTGAITARNVIERIGAVDVTYSWWLLAFFPCSLATILVGWRLTLWLFPPEIAGLEARRSEVQAHFRKAGAWTPAATKASILVLLALGLWLTDWLHGISAAKVAFGVGLIGLLPFVDVLNAEDFRKANMLPYFFVAAALGMSEVLRDTGALKLLTDTFLGGMQPLLANRLVAVSGPLLDGFRLSFLHCKRDINARDLPAHPDAVCEVARPRCAVDRNGLDLLRRWKALCLSIGPPHCRLRLWVFPPHGYAQTGCAADRGRISGAALLYGDFLAAPGLLIALSVVVS